MPYGLTPEEETGLLHQAGKQRFNYYPLLEAQRLLEIMGIPLNSAPTTALPAELQSPQTLSDQRKKADLYSGRLTTSGLDSRPIREVAFSGDTKLLKAPRKEIYNRILDVFTDGGMRGPATKSQRRVAAEASLLDATDIQEALRALARQKRRR